MSASDFAVLSAKVLISDGGLAAEPEAPRYSPTSNRQSHYDHGS